MRVPSCKRTPAKSKACQHVETSSPQWTDEHMKRSDNFLLCILAQSSAGCNRKLFFATCLQHVSTYSTRLLIGSILGAAFAAILHSHAAIDDALTAGNESNRMSRAKASGCTVFKPNTPILAGRSEDFNGQFDSVTPSADGGPSSAPCRWDGPLPRDPSPRCYWIGCIVHSRQEIT